MSTDFGFQDHSSGGGRDSLMAAIGRAGMTGITAKQLSAVTRLAEEDVSARLERLSNSRDIARIGRGLWVLREFAVIETSDKRFRGACRRSPR